MSKNKMIYDVEDKPNLKVLLLVALQHLFAVFGSTILVPTLVNNMIGYEVLSIPAALLAAGTGTLIYILITKGKSPVYLGSSFAYIAPLVLAYSKAGTGGIFTGILIIGIIYLIVALLIKFAGKKWIDKLLPPVVMGPMIIIIGLSLASTVVSQIGLNPSGTINVKELSIAFVTFIATVIVALKAKGFLKASPFLIGILAGYIYSVIIGVIDFSKVIEAPLFSFPNLSFPVVDYIPNINALLLIVPLAIVSITEHIGTHYALGVIVDKPLLKSPGVHKTLFANGLSIIFASLIGAPVNTIYGENTSVIGITKVASTRAVALSAVFIIALAFSAKASALLESIPMPVLGSITLLLYGFILINGLKVIIENKVDYSSFRNIIIISAMLIIGLGGAAFVFETKDTTVAISAMSLAAILGILLNLFLPKDNDK